MRHLPLSPPSVWPDKQLEWLLGATFAHAATVGPPPEPSAILSLARRLEVSARLALHWQPSVPADHDVAWLAREIHEDYRTNLAVEALLGRCLERVTECAGRVSIPLVALKHAALRSANVIEAGSRVVGDIDLLVPRERAKDLWYALLLEGFSPTRTRAYPHQLEALVDPFGAVVELHTRIPGVSRALGRFSTANQLLGGDSLRTQAGGLLTPRPRILAAHALAHGLVQNWATPQSYSPLRMISDLVDLEVIEPGAVLGAADYLPRHLASTCAAAAELCRALTNGSFPELDVQHPDADALLRHCIAARCNAEYAQHLRGAGLRQKLSDGSSLPEIAQYVLGALFPSSAELDALQGPAASTRARVQRTLVRPIVLGRRVVRRWIDRRVRRS